MPRGICSICSHPEAEQIDEALAQRNCNQRDVAKRWNIPKSNVSRHKTLHLRPRLRKAAEDHQGTSATSILQRMAEANAAAMKKLKRSDAEVS